MSALRKRPKSPKRDDPKRQIAFRVAGEAVVAMSRGLNVEEATIDTIGDRVGYVQIQHPKDMKPHQARGREIMASLAWPGTSRNVYISEATTIQLRMIPSWPSVRGVDLARVPSQPGFPRMPNES